MDFIEKAKIRIEHWIKHNEDHFQEYKAFAFELETAGKNEAARYIQEMAALAAQGKEYLGKALRSLE